MPSSPQFRSASNAERIRVSIPTNCTYPQCFSIDSILPRTAPDIFPTACAFNQEGCEHFPQSKVLLRLALKLLGSSLKFARKLGTRPETLVSHFCSRNSQTLQSNQGVLPALCIRI